MRNHRLVAAATLTIGLILGITIAACTPAQATTTCTNHLARTLDRAGFHGHANHIAWAIVMRESRGQNIGPSDPRWNGADYGIWQINAPTWSTQPWWSTTAMLTPTKQSRIAYRHLTHKATDWRMWGINSTGTGMDTTYYGMWDPTTQWQWIWSPYSHYYDDYPC